MISGSKQKYAFDLVALQGEASPSGVNVLTALPTQNVDQFISYGLVDVFVQMHGELQGDLATCFASKCYDMMVDAVRFCRMGAELSYCASHDLEPIYDPAQNKIISYLQVGGDAPPTFIQDFWKRPDQSGWKGVARIVKRRAEHLIRERFVSADTHDLLFPNALLNEYLCAHDDKTLGLYPYHYPWPRTTGQTTTDVADIAQRFVDVLVPRFRAAVGGVSVYEENVVRALRYVLVWHLEQALADLKTLQDGWLLKHKQGTLIGGTPKYLGRLLSALYRREGKEVWRFSHGGERGLYSDYHWGICELTEATRYFMHGAGEARLVDGRLKSGELPMITTAPEWTPAPAKGI